MAVGSLIQPVDDHQLGVAEVIALAHQGESWVQQSNYSSSYYIAAASGAPLPVLPAQSILVDVDIELVRSAQRALFESASELDSRTAELRAVNDEQLHLSEHLAVLDAREENSRAQLAVLEGAVAEAQAERGRARDDLAVSQQQLSAVHRSLLHRAAFSGQRVVAKLTRLTRRFRRQRSVSDPSTEGDS